ncbi:MAG: hypothetical protein Q9212_001639 [Teloschistes hypoglaucus]
MAKNPMNLGIDPCRLQVSSAGDAGRVDFHAVLSDYEDCEDDRQIGQIGAQSVDSICLAWAVLLRCHVASDTVSFGLYAGTTNEGRSDPGKRLQLASGVKNVSIRRYNTVTGRSSYDVMPDAESAVSEAAMNDVAINTAVRLYETSTMNHGFEDNVSSKPLEDWIDVEVSFELKDGASMIAVRTRRSTIPFHYGQTIARSLRSIIRESTSHREALCSSLQAVSPEDKAILRSWYQGDLFSDSTCLHHKVGLTIASMPDSEAVCAWDGSMTYAELDSASTQVAKQLVLLGVRVGDLVPLSFEKSLYAVVAALGILKAGAAFVPLDPNHPTERLEEIMGTIQARLVVTSIRWESKYAALGKKTLVVTSIMLDIARETDETLDFPSVSPQDPAFVLFTSGSTGQPKGMVHDHAAAVTHSIANGECMGYNARVFQFSAFTFDMAVWDMFSTLILGGCVCIPSDEDRMNNLPQAMNSMAVEFAFLTPSVASLLQPAEISTLKRLACGGEAFRQEIVQRWRGRIELINLYGIAESGTIAVRHLDQDGLASRIETVGHTLPTLCGVLVDPEDHDRLVPIGAIGELMVTGTTISRGYINSEAKNRTSFISNPPWAIALGLESRIFYKTGDLLQYNVGTFDGQMDFVRRKDGQLKYHGQRMEAGEVEHHLNGIPGVAVSAVVLPTLGCFSGRLVAAVQMSSSAVQKFNKESLWVDHAHSLPISVVKAHLSKTLPGYMIPAECILIGNMPFTPSCKVDRKSVRAWLENLQGRPDESRVAVESTQNNVLTKSDITARVLSLQIADMVATRDACLAKQLQNQDFLLQDAGIDSIQTASLAMFVQNTFGVKLPMSVFLSSSSTVRDLSRIIDNDSLDGEEHTKKVDLLHEVELHGRDLLDAIDQRSSEYYNVFLTGASGYLGTSILQKLLKDSGANVTVLTRCPSVAEALDQIRRKGTRHGWWLDEYSSRIDIWQGDLTEPGLGLSDENLQRFHRTIDAIIHNGATVHYSRDYDALKASNLQSTRELLKIAAATPSISAFVYVSGGRSPSAIELSESDDASEAQGDSGYASSKFVAEYLVRRFMDHPAFAAKTIKIIRPGYIIGSPGNGIANLTDFIWRLVAGCIEIQSINQEDLDRWLFISDVEHVADVVTSTFTKPDPRVVHRVDQILDGTLLSSLWNVLRVDCGYHLLPLPHSDWLHSLKSSVVDKGESHLLFPLLHTLEKGEGRIGSQHAPSQTEEVSSRVKHAIRANIQFLIIEGFLQAPPGRGPTSLTTAETEDRPSTASDSDRTSSFSLTTSATKSSMSSSDPDTAHSSASSVKEEKVAS